MTESLYRPNVGIVLLYKGLIFLGKRLDQPLKGEHAWQMPQGGIDENETPKKAALRELLEEIGTQNVTILKESKEWYQYDFPQHLQSNVWEGKFKGQRQKWFLMDFQGHPEDIQLNTHHPEFSDMMWATPSEVLNYVVPFKRNVYEKVFQEFFEDI